MVRRSLAPIRTTSRFNARFRMLAAALAAAMLAMPALRRAPTP